MELVSDVFNEIDRLKPRLIKLTQEMVAIPSSNPPGNEVEISNYLMDKLDSFGFEPQQVESLPDRMNTLGQLRGSKGDKSLVWNGHVDTVPVGNPDYWTFDPLGGEVRDGLIYGRGSGDMKGAIASAMVAAIAIQEAGFELSGDLHIHAVADEEYFGRYGSKYLCERGYLKGIKMGIVGEASTSDGKIMARPAVRGRTLVRVHVKGRSAHSSRPQLGINAVLKMSKILLAINDTEFNFPKHKILPDPTIAPGTMIKGGTKDNIIPEECETITDVRTVPGMMPEGVLGDIRKIVEDLKVEDPELEATVTTPLNKPPSEISVNHPLYEAADRATKEVMGYALEPVGASGSNDTSYLTNIADIPAMAFGPGGGNAHAPDEWVDIETLVNFAKIYAHMFMDILG
ncbi:ArgE/DapE family deacylase [Candidatus Bathyarchaeota archaeon]|nr:ArgE/DapE family deacylase [Candidatus Bathyarchaeota archaeon]